MSGGGRNGDENENEDKDKVEDGEVEKAANDSTRESEKASAGKDNSCAAKAGTRPGLRSGDTKARPAEKGKEKNLGGNSPIGAVEEDGSSTVSLLTREL